MYIFLHHLLEDPAMDNPPPFIWIENWSSIAEDGKWEDEEMIKTGYWDYNVESLSVKCLIAVARQIVKSNQQELFIHDLVKKVCEHVDRKIIMPDEVIAEIVTQEYPNCKECWSCNVEKNSPLCADCWNSDACLYY